MTLLRPLRWFLCHQVLGPIIVSIVQMIKDTIVVFFLFLNIFIAFSVGIYSMFKPFCVKPRENATIFNETNSDNFTMQNATIFDETNSDNFTMHQDDFKFFSGVMHVMFWRILDPGQPRYVTIVHGGGNDTNDSDEMVFNKVSHQFSHLVGIFLFGLYQIILIVLFINTLIAMMNTTFLKIWESSDVQWKFSKGKAGIEVIL